MTIRHRIGAPTVPLPSRRWRRAAQLAGLSGGVGVLFVLLAPSGPLVAELLRVLAFVVGGAVGGMLLPDPPRDS